LNQYRLIQLLLLMTFFANTFAQFDEFATAESEKQFDVVRVSAAPAIDGVLSPGEWSQATRVNDFHQTEPVQYGEPTERTEFFISYDDNFLYIAANLYDSEPNKIIGRQMVQGQQFWSDDWISIVLDPFNDKRSGYQFKVNPNGLRVDALFESANETNDDWDGIWVAYASIDSDGWHVELAIPFKTLSFDPANASWGINFSRNIERKSERLAWSSFNRRVNPSSSGVMQGIAGITQGIGLDITPSLTLRHKTDYEPVTETTSEFEPSLDAFYKITPSLTGVLTINTDFSAVDVDDRRINLTRFSLFFPEKRGFFLQDAEKFRFADIDENGTPFFSRRIGLSDEGEPVDLKVGLKVAGKIRNWNVGLLAVEQDAYQDIEAKRLIVGRASLNVLEESSLGMIFTSGDPTANLDNSLIGFDFNFRNSESLLGRTIESSIWYQQSDTEGLPGDDSAFGVSLRLPNSDGFYGWLRHNSFGRNFNPGLGFVNRNGIRQYNAGAGYSLWPKNGSVRRAKLSLFAEQINATNGDLETRILEFSPLDLSNDSGDALRFSISSTTEVLTEEFEILPAIIIPAGRYSFNRFHLRINGAGQRVLAPSFGISTGSFYSGTQIDTELGLRFRPGKHVFLDLEYAQSDIDLPEGKFKTKLYRARFNLAFNVQWSWVNTLQFDNVSNALGVNSRLKWVREAGKELILVIDRGFERDENKSFKSVSQQLIAKISYIFRF